jgi:hypothetical protein
MRSEVFTAIKTQIVVFWILTPCSDLIGYRRFGGLCYLHLQTEYLNNYENMKPREGEMYRYTVQYLYY